MMQKYTQEGMHFVVYAKRVLEEMEVAQYEKNYQMMVDQEQGETTQVAGGQGGPSAVSGGGNGLNGTSTNVMYKLLAPPS